MTGNQISVDDPRSLWEITRESFKEGTASFFQPLIRLIKLWRSIHAHYRRLEIIGRIAEAALAKGEFDETHSIFRESARAIESSFEEIGHSHVRLENSLAQLAQHMKIAIEVREDVEKQVAKSQETLTISVLAFQELLNISRVQLQERTQLETETSNQLSKLTQVVRYLYESSNAFHTPSQRWGAPHVTFRTPDLMPHINYRDLYRMHCHIEPFEGITNFGITYPENLADRDHLVVGVVGQVPKYLPLTLHNYSNTTHGKADLIREVEAMLRQIQSKIDDLRRTSFATGTACKEVDESAFKAAFLSSELALFKHNQRI